MRVQGEGCTEQEDPSWGCCSCCRMRTGKLEGMRDSAVGKRCGVKRVWMKGRRMKAKGFVVFAAFGDWRDGKLGNLGQEAKRLERELPP